MPKGEPTRSVGLGSSQCYETNSKNSHTNSASQKRSVVAVRAGVPRASRDVLLGLHHISNNK